MLDVASMCKRGSLATIHAHTADIVLQRLAYYVSKSNTSLPEFAVWSLIAQTVDFVVHIDLVRNALEDQPPVRRVTSIIEVGGLGEAGGVSSTEVWGLVDAGGGGDELAQVAPLSQRHLSRLRLAGYRPEQFALRRRWGRWGSDDAVILVASTVVGVVAVIVLVGSDRVPTARQQVDPDLISRSLAGVGCGVIVLAVSGWLVASFVVGIGCLVRGEGLAAPRPRGGERGRADRRVGLVDRESS